MNQAFRQWACAAALVVYSVQGVASGDDAAALAELIDGHIQSRLDAEGLARVPAADDAEFLRRVFLDLHGVVPSAEQARRFLSSTAEGKRTDLIDQLLADPRYGEHFGDLWRQRLISPLANEQRTNPERFAAWLADRFNRNDPWDQIVRDLVTASGKLEENPAVTYLIEGRNPLGVTDLTDLSSRYFLGVRLNCAQCHDHPFADWKQRDYWGMAAFFAEIQTPGRPKMVYMAGVQDNRRLSLTTLKDADMLEGYDPRPPTFLGGQPLPTDSDRALRVELADWITSADNTYFARATVNRAWRHFFGRGIVNPVDDMIASHPPSHPELLAELSRRFIESGYDLKLLCRAIVASRTYQQTSRPHAGGDAPRGEREVELFARMSAKVLSPEQLYDSLVAVLGPPAKTPSINTRLGARFEFSQAFAGDGDADPLRYERGIPHVLRLMNSPQFAGRGMSALVSKTEAAAHSPDDVADELFVTVLSRRPTAAELQLARDHVRDADSPQAAYRELLWALIMSSEFALNH